jgi:hypothetical protein
MTNPEDGYDLKLTRTGTGQFDTEYNANPCQKTRMPKPYRKETYDLEKEAKKIIPSYDETKDIIDKFLNETSDTDGDDDRKSNKEKDKRNRRRDD